MSALNQDWINANGPFVLNLIGRHIGSLVINYFFTGPDGKIIGEEKWSSYSGFFLSMNEEWTFVTAGHAFLEEDEGVEWLRSRGRIQIVRTQIVDCIGEGDRNTHQTTISYPETIYAIDNKELGLDCAFFPLRPVYVASISSNGSIPFHFRLDTPFVASQSRAYGIFGFPNEEKVVAFYNSQVDGEIRPVIVWFEPLGFTSTGDSKYQRFIGKLPFDRPNSAVGLSGGAAFVLYENSNSEIQYQLIGIQSSWNKSTRVVYICLLNSIARYILDTENSQSIQSQ